MKWTAPNAGKMLLIVWQFLFGFGMIACTNPQRHVRMVHETAFDVRGQQVTRINIHQFLEDHEKALLFGSNDKARFALISVIQPKRAKRSTERNRETIRLTLPADALRYENSDAKGQTEDQLHINLQPSSGLIDDAFVFINRYENTTDIVDGYHKMANEIGSCFYRGDLSALDLCESSVRGIVRHDNRVFMIHPLPERFGDGAHVIVESNLNTSSMPNSQHSQTCENSDPNSANSRFSQSSGRQLRSHRQRRFISGTNRVPRVLHIETAVFVDKDLYRHMSKNYATDTETKLIRFVLAMINGVQLLYHHPSLGHEINFVLKRLEILHNDPKGLHRSSDIDVFLNSFCLWQRKFNPVSDADAVHFDHAVILTGLDLYVVGKNGKVSSQVVGLAPVAGMCTATSSCTINEGKHFESVFVVAHEIGHNLGMRHDSAENNCDPSLYIMSPTLGSGKTTWSQCSRNYLKAFLGTHQAKCMFDRGHSGTHLDHSAEGLLPGERFDADQQCLLKYGQNSVRSSVQKLTDVCRDLHCQRDRYTWTSHPSLEGTNCGADMWCKAGTCVPRNPNNDQVESVEPNALVIITANSSDYTQAMSEPSEPAAAIDMLDTPSAHEQTHSSDAANKTPTMSGSDGNNVTAVDSMETTMSPPNRTLSDQSEADSSGHPPNDLTITKISLWSDWASPSDCESGCLFGESGRLREGSTGLRVFTRVCLDTRSRRSCRGQDRRYEACSSRQCYNVPRTTVLEFAQQVCERARKYDKDIVAEGIQEVGANASESCKVFCRSKSAGGAPKTKSWTFPDGTTCRNRDSDPDDTYYCVGGKCEKFTCSNRTTNLFRSDSLYCPESARQTENNVLAERLRDFKSLSLKSQPHSENLVVNTDVVPNNNAPKSGSTTAKRSKYTAQPMPPPSLPSIPNHQHSSSTQSTRGKYEIPFFNPNSRTGWRYKGLEVTRVPKYRSLPPELPQYNIRSSPLIFYHSDVPDAPFPPATSPSDEPPTVIYSSPPSLRPTIRVPPTTLAKLSLSSSSSPLTLTSPSHTIWAVRSGCHFGCITFSKGIQIVESQSPERKSNIQLCDAEPIACDNIQTANEYARKLCYRYTLKVRGLSGHGTQILAGAGDPDRACKVACQDEYLSHRYYLVYGEQGYFPFGTQCSTHGGVDDNRYCVNGQCLQFGPDDVPLKESHLSLALYRSKRETEHGATTTDQRVRRNYVYYSPINITDPLPSDMLHSFVDRLAVSQPYDDMPIHGEHIDFHNPVHIDIDEY